MIYGALTAILHTLLFVNLNNSGKPLISFSFLLYVVVVVVAVRSVLTPHKQTHAHTFHFLCI